MTARPPVRKVVRRPASTPGRTIAGSVPSSGGGISPSSIITGPASVIGGGASWIGNQVGGVVGGWIGDLFKALVPILKVGAGGTIMLVAGAGIVATALVSTPVGAVAVAAHPATRAISQARSASKARGTAKAASGAAPARPDVEPRPSAPKGYRLKKAPASKPAPQGSPPAKMTSKEFRGRVAAGESYKVKRKGGE